MNKAEAEEKIKELQEFITGLPDEDWPVQGSRFWYLEGDGDVSDGSEAYFQPKLAWDKKMLAQGNVYRTKEGAELKARQNAVLSEMRQIADSGGKVDRQYHVICVDGKWQTDWHRIDWKTPSTIAFPSEKLAYKAIDTLDLDCLLEIAR